MIQKYCYPTSELWPQLLKRAEQTNSTELTARVLDIITNVKKFGDAAINKYNQELDQFCSERFKLSWQEIQIGAEQINPELKAAIDLAASNIKKFHFRESNSLRSVQVSDGLVCEERIVPIERVGIYVPGGTAPLISSLLMCAIPAQLAGCKNIVISTPAQKTKNETGNISIPGQTDLSQFVHPGLLYICKLLSLSNVYLVGGAQAIAAMAFGTDSIQASYKIFGPGNSYVMEAKKQISLSGVAIDMPAGPSEVLIIADEQANIKFVAADLLAQAEHGRDSQVILLTTSEKIFNDIESELQSQLQDLPRKELALAALLNSSVILFRDLSEAITFSNAYAPEHLILAIENAREWSYQVTNAASVFIGNYTPESLGDYASGTNHVLPTGGYATSTSGLSVESFQKKIFFQELAENSNHELANAVCLLAETEGLVGHANAMRLRITS